ncbi:histidinol-phosphate transaminase [Entomomonas asaccharolytica]|uniref:Histidinol-phosphate aminotransferase n=1 Tax=Entomomonas asaccharolytica TaxID=2785331 RepID=A0A974NH87_9GAMM|nr:histidinol-phosphate transaminase [Entomomonas asaccharolytica]QQP86543.1 histidinol-phosphate transaminase [Entomomonas asaccharolytica]
MNKYWSPLVNKLTPYVPGEQPKLDKLVKLNTNENPYGPSPKVLEAIKEVTADSLRLYPDPNSDRLKQTIANYYNLEANQVFVGNGSDEVLAIVFQALFKHDDEQRPLLFPDISYSFYPVYCGLYDIHYTAIELDELFQIKVKSYLRPNSGIIFANPNAPTGILLSLEDIAELLEANTESVVVIDEAYIDFGGETAVALVNQFPNLLIVQTLSKSRSLAGLRVGLALGNAELIEALERVKNSFNSYPLDRLAQAGAIAAFEDVEYFNETCQTIIEDRESLVAALEQLQFRVLPSAANFVFARHTKLDAELLATKLRNRGIIVRYFNKARINQFLRITVGTLEQNQQLIDGIIEIMQETE